MQRAVEGHGQAVLLFTAIGARAAVVLLVLRDVHTASAASIALGERARNRRGLGRRGTGKGEDREDCGWEDGNYAAHLGQLKEGVVLVRDVYRGR